MPIQPPPLPPIRVEFITPRPLWYAQWDFWVSVGTLIVAAMTGWYAWETRRLRKGSDKAMAELARHAENAATASRESADAAKRSAQALGEQAEDTRKALQIAQRNADAAELSASATKTLAEVGQRAWVSVVEIKASINAARSYARLPNGFVHVVVTMRNGGNSPALEFVARLWLELRVHAPVQIDATSLDSASAGVVGPRESLQLDRQSVELTPDEWDQLQNRTHSLLLYGICRYKDIFQRTHYTRWCFRYVFETQQFAPWIDKLNTMD